MVLPLICPSAPATGTVTMSRPNSSPECRQKPRVSP